MDTTTEASERTHKLFHIVGIGASAGGLNALEQFFDNMPPDTGMAFVVIQHLSPDFKSLMDDLLSRHTTMPIHRVTNGIELLPDNIYLIPPKTHMTVSQEKLYLTEKTLSLHIELPIDIFFNSLAEDAGDRAVGVVLSGTGSDGSRGIVSIHSAGGLVVVQAPESAQFDGMPRNAIATGVSDFILAPDRIPRILVEYAISPLAVRTKMKHELEVFEEEGEFAGIFALLRRHYNLDFSKYKGATVGRRIRRRMEFRQIPEVSDYAAIV
jgi:two-component system CheB/CheR fusion protein